MLVLSIHDAADSRHNIDDGKKKPAVFYFYDYTKLGTDFLDPRMAKFSAKLKSQKRGVAFALLLDTERMNAWTIFRISFRMSQLDAFKVGWHLTGSLVLLNLR